MLAAPEVPARCVGPDDAAGLLHPAVETEQHRTHHTDARIVVENLQQSVEPPGVDLGVVVEQDDHVPDSVPRPEVAGLHEPLVGRSRDDRDASNVGELGRRLVGRAVVDDDHFERRLVAASRERLQARQRERPLAVDGDHDRRPRRGDRGERRPVLERARSPRPQTIEHRVHPRQATALIELAAGPASPAEATPATSWPDVQLFSVRTDTTHGRRARRSLRGPSTAANSTA